MKPSESQFSEQDYPDEGVDWSWTSEYQDSMAHEMEAEEAKSGPRPAKPTGNFPPKNVKPPF
mgnify:CR=1 FL=1